MTRTRCGIGLLLGSVLVWNVAPPLSAQEAPAGGSAPTVEAGDRGSGLAFELETGPVWQTRNDVQVPNDATGTRFALDGLIGSGPSLAFRLYAEYRLGRRHALRALVAPLQFDGAGALTQPVRFNSTTFTAGVSTEAEYRFDSYRLGYRYRLVSNVRWTVDVGLTAKVRDAAIELEQEGASSTYTNTGFVPLIHASAAWRPAPDWSLALDVDGAAASQGRAFDASLKLYRRISDRWSFSGGYRTLEGGADVDDVYTFAWLHYLVVSAAYRL